MDDHDRVFEAVARYFALLSEPMRVRILHAICCREKTVSEIVAETGATQTNISRHLNTMYRTGVLTRRKEGSFIFYGVHDGLLTEICRTVYMHVIRSNGAGMMARAAIAPFARRPRRSARVPRATGRAAAQ
ncbi:MAG: winged helix-turn-helix domain-containing protein [Burkholderiaceae bacterium]|nr:winged helix-turn-helix domain-containing protein [Burkholderiaceae bacterium]